MTRAVLLAGAAGVCAAGLIAELAAARGEARWRSGPRRRGRAGGDRLPRVTALLTRLGRHVGAPAAPADLDARLAAAGAPLGLTTVDVMALKGGAAVAGALVAVPLVAALPGRLGIVALLSAPAAGFLAPDVLLARRTRARAARMANEFADVLDLLRVAVQAGLPTGRALSEVGRRLPGLLARELGTAAAQLELGVARTAALDGLVARCPVGGIASLAAAIARTDRHGTSLDTALQALVAEARAEQARRIRDDAARAAPKIQLVVALVLVPAVMLLVAAVLVQALAPAA